MKLITNKFTQSIVVFFCFCEAINAQTENTLSFMDNVYQSTYYSPFNKSDFKVSIGLPGISSVYVSAVNSGFALADFYPNGAGTSIDPMTVLSKMKKTEYVSAATQIDLFHVFLQKGAHGFSFHINENINTRFTYARDAALMAWDGNEQFKGGMADLSGFGFDFLHYREYALGYYRSMNKWQFSGKAKFLFGKSVVQTKQSDLTIKVSDDVYQATADGDFVLNSGGFGFTSLYDSTLTNKQIEENALKYIMNTKNKGFALDLGAAYEFSEKLQFNASLTNLGYIKWKDSPYNQSYKESVAFVGVDVFKVLYQNELNGDSLRKGFEKYFDEEFPDSVKIDSTSQEFSTAMPVNFAIGARYDIWKKTYAVGRVNFNAYKGLRTAITLGIYHDWFRWLNVGLTNTMAYGKVLNPGVGLVLKGGPIQFYAITDNFLAARFTRINQVNARFGINLVFGRMKGAEKISSVIQ